MKARGPHTSEPTTGRVRLPTLGVDAEPEPKPRSDPRAAPPPRAARDLGTFDATYLPPGCPRGLPGETREEERAAWGMRVRVRSFHPTPEAIASLAGHLRGEREALRATPIARIIDLFDRLAVRWMNADEPARRAVVPAIAAATGFSPEMVEHSFDLEQESSRAAHLRRALAQELGTAEVLDEFVPNLWLAGPVGKRALRAALALERIGGRAALPALPGRRPMVPNLAAIRNLVPALATRLLRWRDGAEEARSGLAAEGWAVGRSRAVGPEIVGAVFSANIPGLPHLEVMRSFLVKAACLGKVASGEPIFLAAYARTIEQEAPDLARCLAVISIDRDDAEARRALYESVDHLVAYGGPDAVQTMRREVPPRLRATWHGHRLGFAAVLREALTPASFFEVADRLAYDFSVFDQEACLAPAALYVEEGGIVSPTELAGTLAQAMAHWARKLRPRQLPLAAAVEQRRWLDEQRLDGRHIVAAPRGLPYVVVLDPEPRLLPTPPGRCVRIVPMADLGALPEALRPMRAYLQCAALAGPAERTEPLGDELARLGVTRLTRPGLMGLPSMMWRHDGVPCVGSLVRFCDQELVAPRNAAF